LQFSTYSFEELDATRPQKTSPGKIVDKCEGSDYHRSRKNQAQNRETLKTEKTVFRDKLYQFCPIRFLVFHLKSITLRGVTHFFALGLAIFQNVITLIHHIKQQSGQQTTYTYYGTFIKAR
jgi:hypothetical protein